MPCAGYFFQKNSINEEFGMPQPLLTAADLGVVADPVVPNANAAPAPAPPPADAAPPPKNENVAG